MGTRSDQDKDFLKTVISQTLLEDSIEWIRKNMDPEDVFSVHDLETWAENNNYEREE